MKSIQQGPILVHRDDIKNTISVLRLARIVEPGTELDTVAVALGIEEAGLRREVWEIAERAGQKKVLEG